MAIVESVNGDWGAVVVQPRDMVLFREMQGEGVLLDMRTEQYFGFDEVATRIWQVLSGTSSLAAAIDQLLTEFDVDRAVLEADVHELLVELERRELIEVVSGS